MKKEPHTPDGVRVLFLYKLYYNYEKKSNKIKFTEIKQTITLINNTKCLKMHVINPICLNI